MQCWEGLLYSVLEHNWFHLHNLLPSACRKITLCDSSEWCAFQRRGCTWLQAQMSRILHHSPPPHMFVHADVSILTARFWVGRIMVWCWESLCPLVKEIWNFIWSSFSLDSNLVVLWFGFRQNILYLDWYQHFKTLMRTAYRAGVCVWVCVTHRQWTTVRPSPHSLCHFCTWASKLRKAFLESGTSRYADHRRNWNWHTTSWPSWS